jgi:hypothetical protein
MTRDINTTNYGEHQERHDIRLAGSLSPGEGSRGFADLIMMMRHIVDQPDLVRHAVDCPVAVSFEHDGNQWVCNAICISPKKE